MKTYKELKVWGKSMNLVTKIYSLTKSFPSDEKIGLTSQIRRCSVSIPSNIAEGYGRGSLKDYIRFLRISVGSLFELQTQIEISFNLKYLSTTEYNNLYSDLRELERMLTSLVRNLNKKLLQKHQT